MRRNELMWPVPVGWESVCWNSAALTSPDAPRAVRSSTAGTSRPSRTSNAGRTRSLRDEAFMEETPCCKKKGGRGCYLRGCLEVQCIRKRVKRNRRHPPSAGHAARLLCGDELVFKAAEGYREA